MKRRNGNKETDMIRSIRLCLRNNAVLRKTVYPFVFSFMNKIGWKQFVMEGDDALAYQQWCEDHNMEPSEDNAELYVEMTDERLFEKEEDL